MKNRFLSVFLAICMLVGMLPVTAMANDESSLVCTCDTLCTEENGNDECDVCAGDYTQCEYNDKEPECVCDKLCTEESINDECEVCVDDYTQCEYDDEEPECVCDKLCTEESINDECEVCADDYLQCTARTDNNEDDTDIIKDSENELDDNKLDDSSNNEEKDIKSSEKVKKNKSVRSGEAGLSAENPIKVPEEGLAFSNGVVYGISQDWFKEQKKEITGIDDVEENPEFKLYLSVTIPSDINGENIKTIGFDSFNNSYTSEKFENGAMYVQTDNTKKSYLNIGTFSVVSVDMEDAEHLETIEKQAFYGCSDLKGVIVFPDSLKKFGESFAFGNCVQLEGVVWSDSLEYLGDFDGDDPSGSTFYGCSNLRFATTKEKYEEAKEAGKLNEFTDLTFPDGLKFIGNHCFKNAFQPGLGLAVTIPSSVETIGSEAFYNSDGKEIRFSQFVVERTNAQGLSGYNYAAFKWINNAAPDKVCLIIMADKASYDYFLNDNNGFSYVENAVTYPMEVKFINGSVTVETENKLYKQYIQYELDKDTGIWSRNTEYELPEIPGSVEPEPGYKGSIWTMDDKELTVNSKVTSDTATVRPGGELEDPVVTFEVEAFLNKGGTDTVTMKSGQTLTVPINNYYRIDITPNIYHPLKGESKDDIYFWYRWNDSTGERNSDKGFAFGTKTNTLKISKMSDARTGSNYYQLDIEGRKVSTSSPWYGADTEVYTSSDKQYYIKINLTQSPENLAWVQASEYQYFIDNVDKYKLNTIYETADKLISDYLIKIFGNKTEIESDNHEPEELSINYELKDGTNYSAEPGSINTFVWTASQTEFDALGWTNENNIALTGELTIQNPYEIVFSADNSIVAKEYLPKGGTLKVSDFPAVPEKNGYTGSWSITEDITGIDENLKVTAVYTAISYPITYELDGGNNNEDNPVSYTVEENIVLKNPVKSGYKFEGWTYAGQDDPQKDIFIAAGSVSGELHFTAHWSKNSSSGGSGSSIPRAYNVKYHYEDETVNYSYEQGEKVNVKGNVFAAPSGMILAGWSFEEDGKVDYTAGETFRMPSETVDLYAVWEEADFMTHSSYINGYPDNTIGHNKTITRAETAQIFYNLISDKDVHVTKTFKDVPYDAWYAKAVNTLASMGVIEGVGNGMFEPERSVTRAEFTAIAIRFADKETEGENIFRDIYGGEWFYDSVVSATDYEWIKGYPDGTFRPYNSITRTEAVTIVNNMLERAADKEYIDSHIDELKQFNDISSDFWGYYQIMEAANSHSYDIYGSDEKWIG